MKQQHSIFSAIGILGMGRSGQAVYQQADAAAIESYCWDDHQQEYQLQHPDSWPWDRLDVLVISPGIPHLYPQPHRIAEMANQAGVEIISEIEFSLRMGRQGTAVVITGTNGKSTTASLLAHILASAGKDVVLGGNIGTAVTALPNTTHTDILVIEASSYQLETTPSLRPEIGILLNITPDHLDRHNGLDGYISAKSQLLRQTTETGHILLGNDDLCTQAWQVSGTKAAVTRLDDIAIAAETNRGLHEHNPSLQGEHNRVNCLSARLAAQLLGVEDKQIDKAILSFSALPHRLQPVGGIGASIQFINDSKATNGEATSAALSSFNNIYWLAGGMAKADGISACINQLGQVKQGYFFGQAATAFATTAQPHIPVKTYQLLDEAVSDAVQDALAAQSFDSAAKATILLSPAAASFDQFKSFEDRGVTFTRLAQQLATAHAQPPAQQELSC